MQSAENLQVTKLARVIAQTVYQATSAFPQAERFGLAAQMRRAAVSIGSNICEGCGRRGDRELVQFLHVAFGSASELQFQLELAIDLGLLSQERSAPLLTEVIRGKKMLSRLIKALCAPPVERSNGRTASKGAPN